jgi:aldehyde dehydrogenase (NAD+)
MGKPLSQARGDVEESRNITNFFAGLVEVSLGQTSLNAADHLNMSLRQPYGVVAAIVPWNFPLMMVGP